ncbi:MAG TPA: site-specific integrase [Gemmataceae bacterium]|jgi:integrase|nr:site-specific integrase [Gemmataceae bacterium]
MSENRVTVWIQHFNDRPHLVLQWTDPETGRRKSRSAKTSDPEKAEGARADLEYELKHGKYQEASLMTWDQFREKFEDEYVAGGRPDTQDNYRATLDLFERICNPRQIRSISERTVSLFVAGLRKEPGRRNKNGMMASTIKVRLQFLHCALAWAVGQGMLPKCPKFPRIKVPKKDPQPVFKETFERLFDQAEDDPTRAFLLCGWLAGLRLSEAFALEWEPNEKAPYVDFGRNKIIVPAEFAKAAKDQWVPLDPVLRDALEAVPRKGTKVFRFRDSKGRPLTASGISQRVRDLAKQAGVKLGMHALRRGFGCRYAANVSAHVLQRLMRHANIKTTLDYYANIDAAVEEAVLGAQRNTLRNKRHFEAPDPDASDDVTLDGSKTNFR